MFFMCEFLGQSYQNACEMPALTILKYIRWHYKYNVIINVLKGMGEGKPDNEPKSLLPKIPHPSEWIKK